MSGLSMPLLDRAFNKAREKLDAAMLAAQRTGGTPENEAEISRRWRQYLKFHSAWEKKAWALHQLIRSSP